MSSLLAIKSQKVEILGDLRVLIDEALGSCNEIEGAAVTLQRLRRGMIDRGILAFKSGKATTIQRSFRGLMGRRKALGEALERREARVFSLFKYMTMQIQRCFRGFYSRKYRSNHADRKKFIGDLEETGRKVREMMYNYAQDQAVREEKEQREKQNKDFEFYSQNLHHLMSTKQIRGVFNPPEQYMEVPRWRDTPVEDHVRNNIRDLLRTRGVSKTGLVVDLNGSRKIPLRGLQSRLSIQASAPYDSLANDKKETQMVHNILTRNKGTWFAGGKTNIINHDEVPLSTGDPYVDANLNPLLKKGVPESQNQLLESARTQKALFDPPLDRPFYSRTGGNRSAVHHNGLFDVIGDAQESGGVTQRALGKSTRFGVPDSCDNRPPGGVLPEPPIRASTMRVSRPRVNKMTVKTKPVDKRSTVDAVVGLSGVAKFQRNTYNNEEVDNTEDGNNQFEGKADNFQPMGSDPWASSDDEE